MSWPPRLFAVVACAASVQAADAAGRLPERYRDDYIAVHAGIPDAGTRPLHIGDVLTFVVSVEFDAGTVQLEAFDEVFFQRSFETAAGFRLHGPPQVAVGEQHGRTRLSARWRFQVLGCPGELDTCRGAKRYELPMMSVSYQLKDGSGDVQNTKSARFRPWPNPLVLAPAVSAAVGQDAELTDYFPAGAWPVPQPLDERASTGWVTAAGGALILLLGIGAGARKVDLPQRRERSATEASRWERLYMTLSRDDLPDDQWADGLRRCVTWYCQDELGSNPCGWLRQDAPQDRSGPVTQAEWRRLYLDVLHLESVPRTERLGLLTRIAELARLASPDSGRRA